MLSAEPLLVTVLQIGPGHLWVRSPPGLEPLDDVVLTSAAGAGQVYCKVAEVASESAPEASLRCRLLISAIGSGVSG